MQNKDETPKPKKTKKSFQKNEIKPIDYDDNQLKSLESNTFTSDQIRKLLKEVMMERVYESKVRTNTEVDALMHTMEEFLRSFIVVGYNMKNEPLVLTNAKSQLDADALYTSLARLFFSINHNGGM